LVDRSSFVDLLDEVTWRVHKIKSCTNNASKNCLSRLMPMSLSTTVQLF
jgi:hypothetical protein